MNLKISLIRLFLRLVGLIKGEQYRYSQEYEDNFKYMDLEEKVWWGYKALIKQIEQAEKGKGIEEYFARQVLDFTPPDDFIRETQMTITAAGDLSASEIIYPESTQHLWDDIAEFYFSGDLVVANLEAPIDLTKAPSGVPEVCLTAPNLNISAEMFDIFTHDGKGVNFFSTANNHSLDQGETGLTATLDFLESRGYPFVGTARTQEEQADVPVIEKNGIRIALLAYTYCMNGKDPIPGKEYMTNEIRLNKPGTDLSLIQQHVEKAHQKNADLIVAIPHWSVEFETYPLQNMIDMGHRMLECGIDVILGGHPHVAQPMEVHHFTDPYTGQQKKGFILYSFGELVSYNAFSKNSRLALTLKLEISKGTVRGRSSTMVTNLQVLPIYTWFRRINGQDDYRLLDFLKVMATLQAGENPYEFSSQQIKEMQRLEQLLYQKILPTDCSKILVPEMRREKHVS